MKRKWKNESLISLLSFLFYIYIYNILSFSKIYRNDHAYTSEINHEKVLYAASAQLCN